MELGELKLDLEISTSESVYRRILIKRGDIISHRSMEGGSYKPLPQSKDIHASSKPFLLELRSSKAFILVVVTVAIFTDTFFYTLIIPILPDLLERRADIPPQRAQQWISILLSAYALTNLITAPIAGIFADRSKSRKPALLTGLVAMTASTTMFAFGKNVAVLVIARALQGASAAVIRVGGLALITDTFGASKSGTAMGWQSLGMLVGSFTGPSIAGVLYDNFGHFAVFIAAYAVLLIDIVFRLVMIERKEAAKWKADVRDSEDDDTSEEAERTPLNRHSTENVPEVGAARSCSYVNESTHDIESGAVPNSIPLRTSSPIFMLLKKRRLLAALWATFACAVIMTALESVIPLYAMRLFSWTPTQTGLLIIALSISVVVDPLLGSLADKYGSRWFSVVGFTTVTVVYGFAVTVVHNQKSDKIVLCLLLVVLGFAIGAIATPNTVEISLLVSSEEKNNNLGSFRADQVMGQAYATLSVSYQLGSLVGPAWGGVVMATQGWVVTCVSFAVLAGVSMVIMLSFAGERKKKELPLTVYSR